MPWDAVEVVQLLMQTCGRRHVLEIGSGAFTSELRSHAIPSTIAAWSLAQSTSIGESETVLLVAPPGIAPNEAAFQRACKAAQRFLIVLLEAATEGNANSGILAHAIHNLGFRNHPLQAMVAPYAGVNNQDRAILLFERLPAELPFASDVDSAAAARAEAARIYVRAGDRCAVVDGSDATACATIADGTLAQKVLGVLPTPEARENAMVAWPNRPALVFQTADDSESLAPKVLDSLLVLRSHTKSIPEWLTSGKKLLTPGGRMIVALPRSEGRTFADAVTSEWLVEHVLAQTLAASPNGPMLVEVDSVDTPTPADWLVWIAMLDPIGGEVVPYVETTYAERATRGNVVAFGRDYDNAWLVRAMVSIGPRTRSRRVLQHLAERVRQTARPASADYGAALCIAGYRLLETDADSEALEDLALAIQHYISLPAGNAHVERWKISNEYLLACLYMAKGDFEQARSLFSTCASRDCLAFGPLLATKTVDAAYIAGALALGQNDPAAARAHWLRGLTITRAVLSGSWDEIWGDIEEPLLFGMREATAVLDRATRCANGLAFLRQNAYRPGLLGGQLEVSLSNSLRVAEHSLRQNQGRLEELSQQHQLLQQWVDDLQASKNWLEEKYRASRTEEAERQLQLQNVTSLLEERTIEAVRLESVVTRENNAKESLAREVRHLLSRVAELEEKLNRRLLDRARRWFQ